MGYFFDSFTSPHFQLMLFIYVAVAVLQASLALWAAHSRRHWFIRAAAVWLGISLLIPTRAVEPALVFALAAPLIVTTVRISRWRLERTTGPAFQFSLRDILLFMLLVGLSTVSLMAILRGTLELDLPAFAGLAITFASLTIAGYYTVFGKRRWLAGLATMALIPGGVLLLWLTAGNTRIWNPLGAAMLSVFFSQADLIILTFALAEYALALVLTLVLFRKAAAQSDSSAWQLLARAAAIAFLLPVGVLLAIVYWGMVKPTPLPPEFQNPGNRYFEILAIAEKVQDLNPSDVAIVNLFPTAAHPEPAAEFASLYRELQPLLQRENSVDARPDLSEIGGVDRTMKRARSCRSLARSLSAESQVASGSKRPDLAADYAEANLRLGAMLERGGFEVDVLVGRAIQGMGWYDLAALRSQIPSPQARRLIQTLNDLELNREPLPPMLARDRALMDRLWPDRFSDVVTNLVTDEVHSLQYSMETMFRRYDAQVHLLQTELAIRLFREEHQRVPTTLKELVPDYLPAIPLDPYSGQPLIYRATDNSHLLYSVGPDGNDDGGKLGTWEDIAGEETGFDLDIDTNTRPTTPPAAVPTNANQPPAAKP